MYPEHNEDMEKTLIQTTSSQQNMSETQSTIVQFGNFEVQAKLGEGGMGKVYKVLDTRNQKICALKVIEKNWDNVTLARFFREAKSLANLNHPNIVKFYEFGKLKTNQYYLLMEYVEGVSFEKIMKKNSLRRNLLALQKLANALGYVHDNQFLHRDIKPSNIIINEDGEPYLMDFGIVKFLDNDQKITQMGSIVGTPAYMSPEQIKGEDNIDCRSDIYSLGIILYEILTKELPFGDTIHSVLENLVDRPHISPKKLNPKVSSELEAICLRAMAFRRNRRYEKAHELAQELKAYIKSRNFVTQRNIKIAKSSHNKTFIILIAMIVVVVSCIFFLLFSQIKETSVVLKKNQPQNQVSQAPTNKEKKKELVVEENVLTQEVRAYCSEVEKKIKLLYLVSDLQKSTDSLLLLKDINQFLIVHKSKLSEYEKSLFHPFTRELYSFLINVFQKCIKSSAVFSESIDQWQNIFLHIDSYWKNFEMHWNEYYKPTELLYSFITLYIEAKCAFYNIKVAVSNIEKQEIYFVKYRESYLFALKKSEVLLKKNVKKQNFIDFTIDFATYPFFLKESSQTLFSQKSTEANKIWNKFLLKIKKGNKNLTARIFLMILQNKKDTFSNINIKEYIKSIKDFHRYFNTVDRLPANHKEAFLTICGENFYKVTDFFFDLNKMGINQHLFLQQVNFEGQKTSIYEAASLLKKDIVKMYILIPNYEQWIVNKKIARKLWNCNKMNVNWFQEWRKAYSVNILEKLKKDEAPFREIDLLNENIENSYKIVIRHSKYCYIYYQK